MITLGTLKTEFANFLVNQTIATRLPDWIQWVLTDILAEYDYWWNKKRWTFTTVSGTAEYFLDHRVNMSQINRLWDTTNNGIITKCDIEDIYNYDPTPTETGTPTKFAFLGQAYVQGATTSAGTISVVSSSANDLNITVIVRGRVSGIDRIESLTLNGTNSVTGTLSWDAGEPESVVLGSACVGYVTATIGLITIATIPPGYLRVEAPRIRLQLVPAGAYSITYIGYQKAVKPTNDSDTIEIPDEAFKALRYGIEEIGWINNGDRDFAQTAAQEAKNARRELYNWSTRNLKGYEVKDYNPIASFGERLPRIINATITG